MLTLLLVIKTFHPIYDYTYVIVYIGAYEYLLRKTSGRDIDVSRLFIYYNARMKDKEEDEKLSDSGCTVTSAIEALEELGTCLESIYPYNIKRVNKRPTDKAFEAAENNKITSALQLNINLYEMKSCLAQGFPFVFGLELFDSFDKGSKKGVIPMPTAGEKRRAKHEGFDLIFNYIDNLE